MTDIRKTSPFDPSNPYNRETKEVARPSFATICVDLAQSLARRSTCSRLQVGCVIASYDYRKVIAWGYNGGASGLENECASLEPSACGHNTRRIQCHYQLRCSA